MAASKHDTLHYHISGDYFNKGGLCLILNTEGGFYEILEEAKTRQDTKKETIPVVIHWQDRGGHYKYKRTIYLTTDELPKGVRTEKAKWEIL